MRRDRIADAGLHVAPPAVIAAGKAHQMRPSGVIARQPHRLHDRLGAGHVKRDFVEAGNPGEPPHVLGHHGMVGAEHRSERMGARLADLDALFIEVVAEDVDAVGAGEVVKDVAVDVGDGDAGRRGHEGADAEILAHQAAVLERHPIGAGELQVGDLRGGFRRHPPALGEALLIERGQRKEAVLAFRRYITGRAVGAEEVVGVEFIKRDQPRQAARHLRVPGQRPVLGQRQLDPGLDLRSHRCGRRHRAGGQRKNWKRRIHNHSANQSS